MTHSTKVPIDVAALAARIVASFPALDERGRRIALATYRTLAQGEPVPDYALAAATRLEIGEVRDAMAGWPGVYRNDRGRIVGFWGLALTDTPHRLEVEGRTLYAWCAWDTLFLPGLLGRPARVTSRSGGHGEVLTLEVTPATAAASAPDVHVSFVDPERADVAGDRVISSFCHHILFFASGEVGRAWVAGKGEGTFLLTLADAFALAREVNRIRYGVTPPG